MFAMVSGAMHLKIARVKRDNRTYEYLRLVRSGRDTRGKPTQQVLANLGRLDLLPKEHWERLAISLMRLSGATVYAAEQIGAEKVDMYGPLLVGHRLWEDLGLSEKIGRRVRGRKVDFPVAEAALAMVLNRLVSPRSKLALTRWMQRVYLPQWEGIGLQVQHLYRALDLLEEASGEIEEELFHDQRNLFEPGLDMIFYDLTSTYFEGGGPEEARWGYSRDKRSDRPQILVGLLLNRDGLPLAHKVFPGNRQDAATVPEVLKGLRERFGLQRVIFVGDRGMVSGANLQALEGAGYEYIIGLRKRAGKQCWEALQQVGEEDWQQMDAGLRLASVDAGEGVRVIICHSAGREAEEGEILHSKLQRGGEGLEKTAASKARGSKALRRAQAALTKAKASKYFELWLEDDGRLGFAEREEVIAREREMLGMYLLQTDAEQLSAQEAVRAYKQLQEVEDAFKEMKDFLKLRPVYHYRQGRVEAHVFVCVLAYLLEKMLALRLAQAGVQLTPRRALEELESIQVVTLRLPDRELRVITQPTREARRALRAVGINKLPALTN